LLNDLKGKAVLITGGTRGLGLATGLAFGAQGAAVTLTHKWGSADEDEIRARFAEVGAPEPLIVAADAREDGDTDAVIAALKQRHQAIEVLVSNVAFGQLVEGMDGYSRRSFLQSMEYTAWPTVEHLRRIGHAFGRYPRYVIALSSTGAETFHPRYDVVAACKAALEALCRYLACRLADQDVRVNVVRTRYAETQSFADTMGADCVPFLRRHEPHLLIPLEDTAKAILALASGMMDGVNGQIITVDRGTGFSDNLMGFFERQHRRHPPASGSGETNET
jgi:NAD(P)-dependent dehydrogenase (short-subunit alcohol dehydrogenase family)